MNCGMFVLPPGSFLGIGSVVFSETQHELRGPYLVLLDNFLNGPKMGFLKFIGKFSH